MNLQDGQKKRKKKKSRIISFRYLLFDFVRFTGAIPTLIAFRPKFYYESKRAKKKIRGAALVVANHSDYLDPIKLYVTLWYRRPAIVAIKDIFKTRLSDWFFRHCSCIPIDPERPGIKSISAAIEALNENRVVGIFPEGRINRTEDPLLHFKTGSLLIAAQAGAPIVPVYFKPQKHWYCRVRIAIGEPIDLGEFASGERMTLDEMERAVQYIQEKELQLMEMIKK